MTSKTQWLSEDRPSMNGRRCPIGKRNRPHFERNLVRNFPISGSTELCESYRSISIAGFTRELKALLHMLKIFPHPAGTEGYFIYGPEVYVCRRDYMWQRFCVKCLEDWTQWFASICYNDNLFVLVNMTIARKEWLCWSI